MEKQDTLNVARAVDKQRLGTQNYLQKVRLERERENQLMKEQMQNEEGMVQLARALHEHNLQTQTSHNSKVAKKKKKKNKPSPKSRKERKLKLKKAVDTAAEDGNDSKGGDISKQIQAFKDDNSKEIMRMLQGTYYLT